MGVVVTTTRACLWRLDRQSVVVLWFHVGNEKIWHACRTFFCLLVVCYWHCSSLDNCGWFIGWYSRSLFQLKRSGGGPGIPRSAFFLIILKLWHPYPHVCGYTCGDDYFDSRPFAVKLFSCVFLRVGDKIIHCVKVHRMVVCSYFFLLVIFSINRFFLHNTLLLILFSTFFFIYVYLCSFLFSEQPMKGLIEKCSPSFFSLL